MYKLISDKKKNGINNQRGVSLIELAIFLTITGLLTAATISAYDSYRQRAVIEDTIANFSLVREAMNEYRKREGYFPCPSNPTSSMNSDPVAAGTGACIGAILDLSGTPLGNINGIYRVPSSNPGTDYVLIGAVPFVDLGLKPNEVIDGWGNKIVYAVSEDLADRNVAFDDENNRAISVNSRLGYRFGDEYKSYVIFSHGQNGAGAYNPEGNVVAACADGGDDEEANCDYSDAIFIAAPQEVKSDENPDLARNYSGTDENFDDFFQYNNQGGGEAGSWAQAGGSTDIFTNLNVIGIGTETPNASEARIDVFGNVKAMRVDAEEFCDYDSSDCFFAEVIGGNRVKCDSAQALTGVAYNDGECGNIRVDSVILPNQDCPTGEYVVGLKDTGEIICDSP